MKRFRGYGKSKVANDETEAITDALQIEATAIAVEYGANRNFSVRVAYEPFNMPDE